MKELAKLIAPYLTAILSAIGVYTTSQTKIAMLEYRCERMESEQGGLKEDVKGIKDLLYSIDMKLNVFGAQLEERTRK
jgi:hypothetical protein